MTRPEAPIKTPILLNAFTMSAVSHVVYGLWRHPEDRHHLYQDLEYWRDLGRLLDGSGFDNLFIADALGLLDVYGGSAAASLARGVQSPLTDPLLVASGILGATRRLGVTLTVSTTYEHPYLLARKFTTLDHLGEGRVGWNVVTSQLESAARNLGLETQLDHDERYERADEFLEVAYKLWLSSWEEGAVLRDKGSPAHPEGMFTDPAQVHPIRHRGRFFETPGPFIAEPSPQRVPLLAQAGGSPRGEAFAARHAELVFVAGADRAGIRRKVERLKALAAREGRGPGSIRFVSSAAVVTDSTDEAAREKFADYQRHFDFDSAVIHYSASTNVDFSTVDPEAPIRYLDTQSSRGLLGMFSKAEAGRDWSLRDALAPKGGLGRSPVFVGSGRSVAEALDLWLEETGLDGINLLHLVSPGSFADFITHVIPELRRLGRLRPEPQAPTTLRARLFGEGLDRPPPDHPAHRLARLETLQEALP